MVPSSKTQIKVVNANRDDDISIHSYESYDMMYNLTNDFFSSVIYIFSSTSSLQYK